jgi:hypothetical protein
MTMGMMTSDTLSHVGERKEAAEPQPDRLFESSRPQRARDLVREKALIKGLDVMAAHGRAPYSVADFAAGVEAYEWYRRENDKRAR